MCRQKLLLFRWICASLTPETKCQHRLLFFPKLDKAEHCFWCKFGVQDISYLHEKPPHCLFALYEWITSICSFHLLYIFIQEQQCACLRGNTALCLRLMLQISEWNHHVAYCKVRMNHPLINHLRRKARLHFPVLELFYQSMQSNELYYHKTRAICKCVPVPDLEGKLSVMLWKWRNCMNTYFIKAGTCKDLCEKILDFRTKQSQSLRQ